MKFTIVATSGNAQDILQKVGILAEPTDRDGFFLIDVESLEDLVGLSEVLDEEIIIKHKNRKYYDQDAHEFHGLEIYNDYRE